MLGYNRDEGRCKNKLTSGIKPLQLRSRLYTCGRVHTVLHYCRSKALTMSITTATREKVFNYNIQPSENPQGSRARARLKIS